VSHAQLEEIVEASPHRQVTFTVTISAAADAGSAAIPAGTRLLQETLPTVMSSGPDPVLEACWQSILATGFDPCNPVGGNASNDAVLPGTPVNTVRYLGYQAPAGYVCSAPGSGVSTVNCSATVGDSIAPGQTRVFRFTVSLFDIDHPYLHVDDSAIGGMLPLTLNTSARAIANPDQAFGELDSSNNQSSEEVVIRAPLIRVLHPLSSSPATCALSTGSHSTISVDASGRVFHTGTWQCSLRISSVQSSAPARLVSGALHMSIVADHFPPFSWNSNPVVSELTCATRAVPSVGLSGSFACGSIPSGPTTGAGTWRVACTTGSDVVVPLGTDILCDMIVAATVEGDPVPPTPPFFGFSGGLTPSGIDVAPIRFYLDPEIIRFAAPSTLVKAQIDIGGGSADFD
jgi:hypothetical protein